MNKKSIAIWAFTQNACLLGQQCLDKMENSTLFIPKEKGIIDQRMYAFDNFSDCLTHAFHQYASHIFIMATGIVVRSIAPLIRDKTIDPAVVVLDEAACYVISLISGHLGGANDLAIRIAQKLGARPVITTATDVHGILSFDALAAKIGACIENKALIKLTSNCLLKGAPVALVGPRSLYDRFYHTNKNISHFREPDPAVLKVFEAICIVSEKRWLLPDTINAKTLWVRPCNLALGIGCNTGTSSAEIDKAVMCVLEKHDFSLLSIMGAGTIENKADEAGLSEFSHTYGWQIQYFKKDEINKVNDPVLSSPSTYARKYLGVKGVAEPTALLTAGKDAELIVPKQKIGNVTIAVARVKVLAAPVKTGKLFLVGLGPGDEKYMTVHARRIIEKSEVVVGYHRYIEMISELIADKKVITSSMTQEKKRVEAAIKAAFEGNIVAFVCSGDTGIYGLAGLVFETMKKSQITIDVEISPGITAGISAATLVGAPLINDFITISLSDLLTPTETVRARIKIAAESDMVTVVYNPTSKKRTVLINELQKEFLKYREPATLVALVTHALRSGQHVTITELDKFLDYEINMNTVLIIGNSDTTVIDGRMVTKRGYERKPR